MTLGQAIDITGRKDDSGEPVPFSIHFVTYDRKRNKPSKHIHWKNAIRCGASHHLGRWDQIGVKPLDGSHPQVAVNLALIIAINGEPVT